MDPIGLAGGINTYSYVDEPLTWVDGSVGWKGCVVLEGDGTTHDIVLILTKKYKEAFGHIEDVINQKKQRYYIL
ncbi:hypothetical protein [Cronobacter dublinensis]|uniref:hypothetical protein n=1 Tax=Cronobacter dublinensis TaxID=413497 RepID=UPI003F8D772A